MESVRPEVEASGDPVRGQESRRELSSRYYGRQGARRLREKKVHRASGPLQTTWLAYLVVPCRSRLERLLFPVSVQIEYSS